MIALTMFFYPRKIPCPKGICEECKCLGYKTEISQPVNAAITETFYRYCFGIIYKCEKPTARLF